MLVDLDGIDGEVVTAVAVVRDRIAKCFGEARHAVADDAREAQHQGRRQVTGAKAVDNFVQVDFRTRGLALVR